MGTDSAATLKANLDALSPLTRRALAAADSDAVVQVHEGDLPSASLRTPDGRTVRIHSGRDPVTEADRFVEAALGAVPGGIPGAVIVIGPGLGYALEAIERRAPGTRLIALEPFPALARGMLARRDWRDSIASRRLTLLVGPDYAGAGDAARLFDERAAASVSILEHPVVSREFPGEVARAQAAADQIVKGARLNATARKAFAGRYLLNTLRNLPALLAEGDVASLADAFAGVPAIVVAAGPSLDNSFEQLARLHDSAVMVAVDTTLRPLRAVGIRPHIVVAVDPSELNARHLLGLDETEGSWLVSEGSIDPKVFPQFAGRVFSFKVSDHQPWPWLRSLGFDRGMLRAWGSVLTTALDLAIHLGCDPITFVGADLAYTDGVHYCRGTMNEDPATHRAEAAVRAAGFERVQRQLNRPTAAAMDIHGAVVTSTPQFVQFRDWLVSRALEAAPRRVSNATGAGILHGGDITQIDLAAAGAAPGIGIAERLRDTWNASSAISRESERRLASALTSPTLDTLPLETWQEFAAGALSREEIVSQIRRTWQSAPVVNANPVSARVVPGRTVRLAVGASGWQAAVQWQTSPDAGATWVDVPGATGTTHAFPMTESADGRQFRAALSNAWGSATSEPAVLGVARPGVPCDFDGDGRPDLLWRHAVTADMVVWVMDGAKVRRVDAVARKEPDFDWRVAGLGDFNGNGRPDVVWRHRRTGALRVWHLDGTIPIGDARPDMEPDPFWQVAAIVDLDGDGRPDILWHNVATGASRVWLLDGTVRTGVEMLDPEPDRAWRLVGAGDFNEDGRPDLLWRNIETGDNRVWHLEGITRAGVEGLESQDPSWRVVAIGDYDGDGRPDVLWRHGRTGACALWHMDGSRRTGVTPLHSVPDRNWLVCPEPS